MSRTILSILCLAMVTFPASIFAETKDKTNQPASVTEAKTPAPEATSHADLTVLSDSTIKSDDSPLVRAAKASRARAAKTAPVAVIDNRSVKKASGNLSESTYIPPAESILNKKFDSTAVSQAAPQTRPTQTVKKNDEDTHKLDGLEREHARLAAESEEVYPTDMDEAAIEKRMHDLQQVIDAEDKTKDSGTSTARPQ